MAEIANTLWYRLGTISATDGSTKVTGVGTHFTTAGINPGATLRIDGRFYAYEVKRVVSDTELELAVPYYGGNISAASYSIDRNFQSTTNAKLAADVTDLVGLYEQVRNGTVTTIEGKSAYQVAVANGFKGTESEWLESLKGAGEITAINTKLGRIYKNSATAHNAVPRGKNLGTTITDAQLQAVRNGTFDDLYIGDYWSLPVDGGTTALIVGCNCYCVTYSAEGQINLPNSNLCVWLKNDSWKFPMNDTDTCAGHLKGSKLYNETFPALVAKLEAVLPSGSLRESTHWITDSINANGVPNHMVIDKMKLFLPSRHNLGVMPGRSSRNSAYQGQEQILWPYSLFHKTPLWAFFWLDTTYDATQWECAFDSRWGDTFPIKASLVRTVWPYCYIG